MQYSVAVDSVNGPNFTSAVTLSAGVAMMPEDGSTVKELMAAADKALYAAKKAGRNRVVTEDELALEHERVAG